MGRVSSPRRRCTLYRTMQQASLWKQPRQHSSGLKRSTALRLCRLTRGYNHKDLAVPLKGAISRREDEAESIENAEKKLLVVTDPDMNSDASTDIETSLSDSEAVSSESEDVDMDLSSSLETQENEDNFQAAPAGEECLRGLSLVLENLVDESRGKAYTPGPFHAGRAARITLAAYIQRIRDFFKCSDECFIIALIYIDRLDKADPRGAVCDLTAHRLLAIATILAVKFQEDIVHRNAFFSKIVGLSLDELNKLEAAMLKMLNWRTFVCAEEYDHYRCLLTSACMREL